MFGLKMITSDGLTISVTLHYITSFLYANDTYSDPWFINKVIQVRKELNEEQANAVAEMVREKCSFVPDWRDVPENALQIFSTRAAEQKVMDELLSSKQTTEYEDVDEGQNSE